MATNDMITLCFFFVPIALVVLFFVVVFFGIMLAKAFEPDLSASKIALKDLERAVMEAQK